jgi:hypothetical protein
MKIGISAVYLKNVLPAMRVLVKAYAYKNPKVILKRVAQSEISIVFKIEALSAGELK